MNIQDRQDDVSGVPEHWFKQLSERLVVLQRRGELTFAQWGLATWLTCNADRRTHQWTGKLRTLIEQTGWKQSEQKLRDDLGALRKLRLIGYETTERSRKPWVITLTGLLVPRDCKVTANKTGASSLHREGAGLQSVGSANPRRQRPSDADTPQPFAQPPSTSNALRGVVLERSSLSIGEGTVEEEGEEEQFGAAADDEEVFDDEAFFAALEKVRSARGAA